MMSLSELATRCEAQDAAEWAEISELFEDAFRVALPKPERIWVTDNRGDWTAEYSAWQCQQSSFYELLEAQAFLDAAMALVPERWAVNIVRTADGRFGNANLYWFRGESPIPTKKVHGSGGTPALALCAAALKVRAASVDTHPEGGDVQQAPSLMGSAVAVEDGQTP